MKKFWNYIIGGLVGLLGVFFIINPSYTFAQIVYFAGLVLLVFGIVRLVFTFSNRLSLILPGNLAFGAIINILIGIILMNNTGILEKSIPVIIGIWLFFSALSKLTIAMNTKNTKLYIDSGLRFLMCIIIFTTPIISVLFTGIFFGILLIFMGIYIIVYYRDNSNMYKVKIK